MVFRHAFNGAVHEWRLRLARSAVFYSRLLWSWFLPDQRHRIGTFSNIFSTLRANLLQRMKRPSLRVNPKIVLLCLSILIFFNGCFPTLGYRPEFSTTSISTSFPSCETALVPSDAKGACLEYYNAVKWGEEVAQAYRTKAFMNEWSVYIAGAVGIIGGAVVGALTATDDGNTDAAKITPPVTAAVVALFALNQSDDKATAYGESIIAIEESLAATDRHVSHNKSKEGFQLGSDILKESIQQEIINLHIRMVAIRKKTTASIPTTTALVPESFEIPAEAPAKSSTNKTPAKAPTLQQHSFAMFTNNLEADLNSIRAIIVPDSGVSIKVEKVENDRVSLTLTNPICQDYLVMLSVKNKLALPARNLRCKN
jgi:hypothetical protein